MHEVVVRICCMGRYCVLKGRPGRGEVTDWSDQMSICVESADRLVFHLILIKICGHCSCNLSKLLPSNHPYGMAITCFVEFFCLWLIDVTLFYIFSNLPVLYHHPSWMP